MGTEEGASYIQELFCALLTNTYMKNFTLFLSALTSKDATVRKVEEK